MTLLKSVRILNSPRQLKRLAVILTSVHGKELNFTTEIYNGTNN